MSYLPPHTVALIRTNLIQAFKMYLDYAGCGSPQTFLLESSNTCALRRNCTAGQYVSSAGDASNDRYGLRFLAGLYLKCGTA